MLTATAAVTRYQAQLQEQQQEVPASAPAAAPAGSTPATPPAASAPADESTDSIIGDILKKPPAPRDESGDGEDEPPPPAPDEDKPDQGDDGEGDEETPDAEADPEADEDEELTDPATPDTLKAARKALSEGNLDEAFRLAFGKKPEQVQPDVKAWTAWRKANDRVQAQHERDRQAVTAQHQQNEQWVTQQRQQLQGVIEQLRPYEKAHQARVAFRQTGDPSYLKQMVVEVAEVPWDDALKAIVTKTRLSPGERQLQQRLEAAERRLEEAERKKTEEAQQQTQQQVYHQDLTTIRGALSGEVTQVPRFAERVYQVLLKTRSPTGLTMTIEQAGRQVLAAERRKLSEHPLLKKRGKTPPAEVSRAASTLARSRPPKPPPSSPPLRRDSHGNGATDEATETTDDIIADILKSTNRRRVAV